MAKNVANSNQAKMEKKIQIKALPPGPLKWRAECTASSSCLLRAGNRLKKNIRRGISHQADQKLAGAIASKPHTILHLTLDG
jgi:hypothetical protein